MTNETTTSDEATTPDETITPDETATPPEFIPLPELVEAQDRARQRFVTARNNPAPPTVDDMERIDVLAEGVLELAATIEFLVPECRDKSLALTHLEDVLTRASRAIYLKNPVGGRKPSLRDVAQARIVEERAAAAAPEGRADDE